MEMVTYRASFDFFVEGDEVVVAAVRFDRGPDVSDGSLPDDPEALAAAASLWGHDEFRTAVSNTLATGSLFVLLERCRRSAQGGHGERFRLQRCPENQII